VAHAIVRRDTPAAKPLDPVARGGSLLKRDRRTKPAAPDVAAEHEGPDAAEDLEPPALDE